MYAKPTLTRFGSFRELTQLGLSQSCDGGFGYRAIDGDWVLCNSGS